MLAWRITFAHLAAQVSQNQPQKMRVITSVA
jgi:hypothetical protein